MRTYVRHQYKTQKICDRATLENGGTLESVPDQCKTHAMHNKAVDSYAHALEFVPDFYKSQKCLIKPPIFILLWKYLLLNAIRLKKCVKSC